MTKSTPFIVIGSKGTALPVRLLELEPDLKLGPNNIKWSTKNPSELVLKTVAWVANSGTPLEIYRREDALRNGLIKALSPVFWQKNGQRYEGTAFVRTNWTPHDQQPQYVAVECPEWEYGVVEAKSMPDGRNNHLVAPLDFKKATDKQTAGPPMKINQFFQEKLGANVKNPRWSWGAFDPLANRVFLRIWEDQIKNHDKGKRVEIYWKNFTVKSAGFNERLEHIQTIKDGAEGIGLICQVEDPSPHGPRKIKSFTESPLFKLGKITEDDGHIYAQIEDPVLLADLSRSKTSQSTLADDLKAIAGNKQLNPTMKEALVNARVGQGAFRSKVLQIWKSGCSVTGSATLDAIRASHIKPWRDSTDTERLDPRNGLPLIANLDALFDAGLISFEGSGSMLVSSKLNEAERFIYGLDKKKLSARPSPETAQYLKYHRTKLFLQ